MNLTFSELNSTEFLNKKIILHSNIFDRFSVPIENLVKKAAGKKKRKNLREWRRVKVSLKSKSRRSKREKRLAMENG